ncbi:hypothetical protein PS627_04557 [Pseudomonas fluorescens]|uniref:hypothetical protein n=1 Tax=Pseudomonas fluorescens TaxID=294 RepID=UPI001253DDE5|nr:hypothetical protein [Pseudomonas fluorescens]CAG8865199.1 hypothetical protein PS627_01154 [Pseudomonas fluorescens]CAG8871608.1 hypothetical protein PS627_04557 [Pseudomonas fluorescens]
MTSLTPLQNLILQFAQGGIASETLRTSVMHSHPALTDGEYLSALLALQNEQRLMGAEIGGSWIFRSRSEEEIEADVPEYSPEFAEMITAADCGEWTEICPDELIAMLDEMLAQARAQPKRGA